MNFFKIISFIGPPIYSFYIKHNILIFPHQKLHLFSSHRTHFLYCKTPVLAYFCRFSDLSSCFHIQMMLFLHFEWLVFHKYCRTLITKNWYNILDLLLSNLSAFGKENFCFEPELFSECFDASRVTDWLSNCSVIWDLQ